MHACTRPAAPSDYNSIIWYHLAACARRTEIAGTISVHIDPRPRSCQDQQELKTTCAGIDASWVFVCSTLCTNTKTTKNTPTIVNSSCLTSHFHHIILSYLQPAESLISSLIMARSKNSQSRANNKAQQQATCHRNHPHCRCVLHAASPIGISSQRPK